MLRELLDRLCRRGDFAPIGPDEMPALPVAGTSTSARLDEVHRRLRGVPTPETSAAVEYMRKQWARGTVPAPRLPTVAPQPGMAGDTALDYAPPMPRMRVDDDLLPRRGPAGGWSRFVEQVVGAQSIVRMLALVEPSCAVDDPARVCHICDAWGADVEHFTHEPTCPYRRAVEWVRANPA